MVFPAGCNLADSAGAARSLFALVPRRADQVILPINDSASRPDHAGPSFYCVHSLSGAGGGDFIDLAQHLGPEIRFFGVQAPPRRIQDPDFGDSVPAIADYYTEALVKFQPAGPVLIGGWSAGATIALEMARGLVARGREVRLIVAIDGAPENTAGEHAQPSLRDLLLLAQTLPGWLVDTVRMKTNVLPSAYRLVQSRLRRLKALTAGARPAAVAPRHPVQIFGDLNRYPPKQRLFMMRLYDAIFRHHAAVYDGELVVYEARKVTPFAPPKYAAKWRSIAVRAEVVSLAGTHISIMRSPAVRALAQDLKARLLDRV